MPRPKTSVRLRRVPKIILVCAPPREKALAERAKERLTDAVLGKFVTIRNPGVEKYGRVLSDLQTSEHESITNYMLADPDIS